MISLQLYSGGINWINHILSPCLDKGFFLAIYIPPSVHVFTSRPLLFFSFTRPVRLRQGVQLGECHAVSTSAKNITFIRPHYITTDILVKMSFANSFQYSFPPGCPSWINVSFIGMRKNTSSKLISKSKQTERERQRRSDWRGKGGRGRYSFFIDYISMAAISSWAVNTRDTKTPISLFVLFSRSLNNFPSTWCIVSVTEK